MKRKISLVLILALGLAAEVTNADFTFGQPTNMGPTVNSSAWDASPSISTDGLSLYFFSDRPGGYGGRDLWLTTRETIDDNWRLPVNLGSSINSAAYDGMPEISSDGLSLYFASERGGGVGGRDIWVATRETIHETWGQPVNLGPTVNSSGWDSCPSITSDGLTLYLDSDRPGGYGRRDLWMSTRVSTRVTTDYAWGPPVNLGDSINTSSDEVTPTIPGDALTVFFASDRHSPGSGDRDIWMINRNDPLEHWREPINLGWPVNTADRDSAPGMSSDGSMLFLSSTRAGGIGSMDIWQVPIMPIVDLNGDGFVDAADMCIMVDYWGTDEPLCDIGPMPWGDGIVDVQDLIVLAEHLFEGIPPDEPEEVNVDEKDAGSQVELEQGQILVVTLESNPTTGYRWEQAETQESILEQMGEAEFKPSDTGEPPLVGAGGWEIFRFKAISAGQMTLQLVYHRPWEEGVEPLNTFSLQVVIR